MFSTHPMADSVTRVNDDRTVEEFLAAASSRTPLVAADGKSGTLLERVVVDGTAYVVKHLSPDDDWIMRLTGDTSFRPWQLWSSPLWSRLPACVDPAVVDMAREDDRLTIVMRDVAQWLVPTGDSVVPLPQHRAFLEHMAALHAAFVGWSDDLGLLPLTRRYTFFAPDSIAGELARDAPPVPVTLAAQGWARFGERVPDLADAVRRLHRDVAPLVAALDRTPRTLVHGDWKLGNLGTGRDGRTILLDWAAPGAAPPLCDLVHYVCLNVDRIPESKDDAIAFYRHALESHGVPTQPWWDEQLELCLLAHMLLFGWEKALGGHAELHWWEEKGHRGLEWLR